MFKLSIQRASKRLEFFRFKCPNCSSSMFATSDARERMCYNCKNLLPDVRRYRELEAFKVCYYRATKFPVIPFFNP